MHYVQMYMPMNILILLELIFEFWMKKSINPDIIFYKTYQYYLPHGNILIVRCVFEFVVFNQLISILCFDKNKNFMNRVFISVII